VAIVTHLVTRSLAADAAIDCLGGGHFPLWRNPRVRISSIVPVARVAVSAPRFRLAVARVWHAIGPARCERTVGLRPEGQWPLPEAAPGTALIRRAKTGMLRSMETPEHERREIEEYLRSQSGPDFEIEHVEKLTSEYVLGDEYSVWDAHTNEGRWWVITNPKNLYSQEQIKSMDVALSFHIGLWTRMQGREGRDLMNRDHRVRALLRRLDVAHESLDRAKEVEDYQAVGMRLRELLLTLTFNLSELIQTPDPTAALQKAANFKALTNIYARTIASGKSAERLRSLLRVTGEHAWEYVTRLTHARKANEQDARIALSVTQAVIEMFLGALVRVQQGKPERCPVCSSYRLKLVRTEDGDSWLKLCEACGSTSVVDVPPTTDQVSKDNDERHAPEGDCVEVEDFGIYLTPSQARSLIKDAKSKAEAEGEKESGDVEYQPIWTNPFAYLLFEDGRQFEDGTPIEDGHLIDVHRLVFASFEHPPSPGSELVYRCSETSCVNAKHAVEQPLSNEHGWQAGIIEQVTLHPSFLELRISISGSPAQRVFVKHDILDLYGLGDASSLTERPVFLTMPTDGDWAQLILAARRVDYSQGSSVAGRQHPPN
jgi:hypothetical protein